MAAASYSKQQVLLLCRHVHRAFVDKNVAEMRRLAPAVTDNLEVIRPGEFAAILHHFAYGRMSDRQFWSRASDALGDVFVDPDPKALALAANAYAKAAVNHQGALQVIADWGVKLGNVQGMVFEPRYIAMLLAGLSKLQFRDEALLKAIAAQVVRQIGQFNHIDIAQIANGFARLKFPSHEVFDALRGPTLAFMAEFSHKNLATLANAHARLGIDDESVLGPVASELAARCQKGAPVPANVLPTVINAYVERLVYVPDDLRRAIEFSLPLVVKDMEPTDIILSVPPLLRVPGLEVTRGFLDPVFRACEGAKDKINAKGNVALMETAQHLGHECPVFWGAALQHCAAGMAAMGRDWEPLLVARIVQLVGRLLDGAPAAERAGAAQPEAAVLDAALGQLSRRLGEYKVRDLADVGVGFLRAGGARGDPGHARRASVLVELLGPGISARAAEGHDGERLGRVVAELRHAASAERA